MKPDWASSFLLLLIVIFAIVFLLSRSGIITAWRASLCEKPPVIIIITDKNIFWLEEEDNESDWDKRCSRRED